MQEINQPWQNFNPIFLPTILSEQIHLIQEMELIYDSLQLKKRGLKKEAFNYAYAGYKKLEEEGKVE